MSKSAPQASGGSADSPPRYPLLESLVAECNRLQEQNFASIHKCIEQAKENLRSGDFAMTLGKADRAYVQFFSAVHIIAVTIPQHREFPTFNAQDRPLRNEYRALYKKVPTLYEKIERLRDEIKASNAFYKNASSAPTEAPQNNIAAQTNGVSKGTLPSTPDDSKRKPPPVSAKPSALSGANFMPGSGRASPSKQGTTNRESVGSFDALQARFEKLRSSKNPSNSPSGLPNGVSPSTDGMPTSRGRATGNRELPVTARLDTKAASGLPRPPSPIYSPARSSISPPRARRATNTALPALTKDTVISPEALSAYLQRSAHISVLLLDIRERDSFDDGHIMAKEMICIEPLVLRENGMSGAQLEELLQLSPDYKDHKLFAQRHTYDLVVYYDESTSSNSFVHESPTQQTLPLKRLHQALCEYSYEKQLKQPPILLAGGINKWIDVYGATSLVATGDSDAAKSARTNGNTHHRPSLSVSPALLKSNGHEGNNISRKLVQSRLARHPKDDVHNVVPIDIEEEQRWLDRLKKEREPLTISVPNSENMDVKRQRRSLSIVSANNPVTYPRTVEEYFKQYPTGSSSGQQSMMTPIVGTPVTGFPTPTTPGFAHRRSTIIDHPFHGFAGSSNPDYNPPPSPVRPPPALPRKSYKGESERPSVRLPLEPPAPLKDGGRLAPGLTGSTNFGTTGLKNLGNTCYMNSILQCMNGTIPLARYFLDGSYKMHINKTNALGSRGLLAEAFANVVKHLWDGQYKFISPMTFKEVSGRLNESFSSNDQQDSQEFLEFLLDGLHEDLNPNANRSKLHELTSAEEARRERLPIEVASYLEWQRYTHRNFSVVVNWFQGQLASRLICQTCQFRSTTFTPFMYLSLPIPPIKNPTLLDCMSEFCREEILEGDDAWTCPKCKVPRRASKRLIITRLPTVLIIHLKRFTNEGRWRDKLGTPVAYPVRDLDLSRYVPQQPPSPNGTVPVTMHVPMQGDVEVPPEMRGPFVYELYGVCNHFGTLNGGHYTATVRNSYSGQWSCFDDSKASRVDEEDVVSRNAYVLFWVRSRVNA